MSLDTESIWSEKILSDVEDALTSSTNRVEYWIHLSCHVVDSENMNSFK